MRQNRRLGVVGLVQFLFRPLKHQPGKRRAERLVNGGEGVARFREPIGQITAHPDPLSPLAGKEQHRHHRITVAPR